MMANCSELMDKAAVQRSLARMTHEIIERNKGCGNLLLLGVKRRGVPLAEILRENIAKFDGAEVPAGILDIARYRDDIESDAEPGDSSEIPADITGKTVVLVDDVIFTGRTVRAAIEAVFARGRPSAIQLAVLIDRGHRELPIRPDFVGKNIPTSREETVEVLVEEIDGCTAVRLLK